MNTSFKANAAQHKAFIASVKKDLSPVSLNGLKANLVMHYKHEHDWAINDVITFYTATGKYFVVKASDLLVSVDEANNAIEPYPLSREEIIAELKSAREELIAELESAEIYQLQEETGYSRQEVIDLLDKAPVQHCASLRERNSIGSLNDNRSNTGWTWSNDDNCFFPDEDPRDEMNGDDWQPTYLDYASEDIPDDLSIQSQDLVDSPDDACDTDNSLDDECNSYWDYLKKANENWWQSDTFCCSDAIINTCENLAKAILDKCSANNLPIPTSIDEVNSFVNSTSIESFQATMIYPYWTVYTIDNVQHKVFTCSNTEECLIGIIQSVAKDSSVDTDNSLDEDALQAAKILFHYWALSGNNLVLPNNWSNLREFVKSIDAKALILDFLWENTHKNQELFFQTLENQAVNYGVHSWFTQKDISVYQQNYQAIVADCNAILELYRQSDILADNGEGEYQLFPKNTKELHALITYIQDKSTADSTVESLKGEEYLFFQVLDTLNSINQTKSVGILA